MYIVTTDGKSFSQLRNTVESKVEVMLRYLMLKMLVADMLIRWRPSFWFENFLFYCYLMRKVILTHDAFFF